ncbi:hypothetical protein KWH02_11560 [Xanthomonas campestris pv. uppalii]|uniref:hypothetical protein n=1 Tax=Xanthomonas euvesicatoria TaxID=456327 RepID=UPI001C480F34|nr:hypothetical protein [Xanthomonas euvesicatoria]MBV6785821.1 hypothetical protein [Xanthomonas campestris pv. uppalii]
MRELKPDITLSVNRALLGEVFTELVAVSCFLASENEFELTFFVDSMIPDFKEEEISCIETEVMADFPEDFKISHKIVVSPQPVLSALNSFWIFLRKA